MIRQSLLTNKIREDVTKGEYLNALLQASADLEFLFFSKLLLEKRIKSNLIKNWTLSRYIDWVCELNLIDKKYEQLLRDFGELRNLMVHTRYSFPKISKDQSKLNFLAQIILAICDFIDSSPVKYRSSWKLEKEYSEAFQKIEEKYERIFNKKKLN
jgi:hypothetical protein